MARQSQERSPVALAAVVALHAAVFATLLHYQPKLTPAQAEVLLVSMMTQPESLPLAQPLPPRPRAKPVREIRKTIAPPLLPAPSESAIDFPPVPPAPEAQVDSAVVVADTPADPEPPAPRVMPRFDAAYLQNTPPAYPALARRSGEQGRVLLRVVVRPDGTPETVELRQSSGSQRLDHAALDAVRRWRFVPARQGNTPVTAAVIVPIVFSLEG
jgi:protein TonB